MKTLHLVIISVILLLTSFSMHTTCANTVNPNATYSNYTVSKQNWFITLKNNYHAGEIVHILGHANPSTVIQIKLKDPNNTVTKYEQTLTDGSGILVSDIKIPSDGIPGVWNIETSDGITSTVKAIIVDPFSPLKQFKSGTVAKDVICSQGFQLVIKSEDGSPACVKPHDVHKLITIGWANKIIRNNIIKSSNATVTLLGSAALSICSAMGGPCVLDPTFQATVVGNDTYAVIFERNGKPYTVTINDTTSCIVPLIVGRPVCYPYGLMP